MALLLAEANRIIEGATATARELKVEISVTVCDAGGRLVALNRMDGAFATSIASGRRGLGHLARHHAPSQRHDDRRCRPPGPAPATGTGSTG